ncbi:antitoxin [Microbacterium sp. JB110]|uniref:antitoxin n=1 Tax=unclassified Microbacterium TaxID=2609290 RepID=UPI00097F32E9|nr:antitoxin [Microbacterium sp. JB110]SJM60734.1 hypothetical protein CZ774_10145 [Frigoribacterium sp. JB110]
MGIDDIAGKAKGFLNSDKAEEISDQVLDGAEGLANKVTGDKFADKVEGARDAADDKIGNE